MILSNFNFRHNYINDFALQYRGSQTIDRESVLVRGSQFRLANLLPSLSTNKKDLEKSTVGLYHQSSPTYRLPDVEIVGEGGARDDYSSSSLSSVTGVYFWWQSIHFTWTLWVRVVDYTLITLSVCSRMCVKEFVMQLRLICFLQYGRVDKNWP